MRYSRSELPKIVGLSVVLVGLIAYLAVGYGKLLGRYQAEQAGHAAAHAAQAAVGPAGGQAAPSQAQAPATAAALIAPAAPPERDPFEPIIPLGWPAQVSAQSARSQQRPSLPILPALAPTRPGREAGALSVSGIVSGPPSLAVLRQGENHFIVRSGDGLPGRIRVVSIGKSTVTLRDGQREYVLRLGE